MLYTELASTRVAIAGPIAIESEDGPTSDSFGRLRIASPQTIFDSKFLYDNEPLFWDDIEFSGAGTSSTFELDEASVVLGVSNSTEGIRIRQSFRRMDYQPGKCQQIVLTGNLCNSGGGQGIKSAFGLFDDNNGIFIRSNGNIIECVLRSSATGSPVETVSPQNNWNLDTMDGTGPSGVRLNFTKSQLLMIDLSWLGVGRVRIGAILKGRLVYFHEFSNENARSGVYMSTANLPVRYQISNDGTGQASTLRQICSTVISEGGKTDSGSLRWESTAGAAVITDAENSIFAVLGIKLKSTHLSAEILLNHIGLQVQTIGECAEWLLIFNPTVAGTFTYGDVVNSAIQVAKGATENTVTNGTVLHGGYIETGQTVVGGDNLLEELRNALLLGSTILGVPDELVLCIRPIGGVSAISVEGGICWRESH